MRIYPLILVIASVALMGQACSLRQQPSTALPSSPPDSAFQTNQPAANNDVPREPANNNETRTESSNAPVSESSQPIVAQPYYIAYSQAEFDRARVANKAVLLYFWAVWCPICKVEEPMIKNTVETSGLDLAGFRVNFDTASELKQQFNVPYQHTTIILDTKGNESARFTGPTSQPMLLEALKVASQN
jgi:thioredoxin 1